MGSPADVIDASALYIRIYFIGMPANMIYTFGSAIMRAVGDTKRPLYFLTVAGIVNIVLNLVFVIVFQMSVAGVAIATIISQTISAVLVMRYLIRSTGSAQLYPPGHAHSSDIPAPDLAHRHTCRVARLSVLHQQCADPVFHQLLRLGSYGGLRRLQQPGKFRIHGHEQHLPGRADVCWAQTTAAAIPPRAKKPVGVPGA